MTILDQLAAHARERVAADQAENSLDVLQAVVLFLVDLRLPPTYFWVSQKEFQVPSFLWRHKRKA